MMQLDWAIRVAQDRLLAAVDEWAQSRGQAQEERLLEANELYRRAIRAKHVACGIKI